ncbi:VanW family protein [Paenibacillaceae bacterium WGS1546]|uniref:VanW family protein n=1 Tax=Cohnella sp. WGS1546 TaxID=3366810 RepID=UPI00372D815A
MRNTRKKASSSRASGLLLLALLLVLAAAVYALNPLGARDYVAEQFGIGGGDGAERPAPLPSPSPEALSAEPAEAEIPESVDKVSASGGTLLSQARSPVTLDGNLAGTEELFSVIPAGQTFSYQEWMLESKAQVDEDGYSQLASLLFETAVKAGLEVGERYVHAKLPDYANPGFDVAVSPRKKDLKLHNPYSFDVAWTLEIENGVPAARMIAQDEGEWTAPRIEVQRTDYLPDTVVLVDFGRSLPAKGDPGALVKVFDGNELLYKDFYPPRAEEMLLAPTAAERSGLTHSGALQETDE